jgi:hypothetical protein
MLASFNDRGHHSTQPTGAPRRWYLILEPSDETSAPPSGHSRKRYPISNTVIRFLATAVPKL